MKYYLTLILAAIFAIPALAVTDKEMDEARAITAKAYLRYANDGSGYLDEITVKSMSELNSKLKAKEKENIKAFNAVKVPSDYASWDKAKLIEFWSVTFFTSPELDAKGKAAKARVKKQISAMTVAAPAPKKEETPAPAETPAPTPEETAPAASDAGTDAQTGMPDAADIAADQEAILNDQEAIEKDAADAAETTTPPQQSHTWVYILVLAILVAVVIWLVVYAANLMKRQPGAGDDDDDDNEESRKQNRKSLAQKENEIAQLHERIQAEESKVAEIGLELERMKLDRKRQDEKIHALKEENNSLKAQLAAALAEGGSRTQSVQEPVRETRRENTEPARAAARANQEPAPRQPKPEPAAPEKPILKVIYLGRANRRGIFVRADRRINPGNTIYRLDTNDGLVGTFHVVDEPEVVDVALSNPEENLAYGCTGEDLLDTAGVTRIITESAGTAIFENGYWKILRKTTIRYE